MARQMEVSKNSKVAANNEGDNKEDAGPGVGGGNEGDAELGPETVDSDDDVSFATVPVANSGSWDF